MPDTDRISADGHPLVSALLEDRAEGGPPVALEIAAGDEMLSFLIAEHGGDLDRGLAAYFGDGMAVWRALSRIVRWHSRDPGTLRKVLDFASGWGRVTRFLVRETEPQRVWVSELQEGAAEFQRELFGVNLLPASESAAAFDCEHRFDAIFVTSLFSHLPEEAFRDWLACLTFLLEPGGLLVFSVHDVSLLDDNEPRPADGFLFRRVSESRSLDLGEYGTSWVDESFVRGVLAELGSGLSVHRIPRGLSNFQDLWVVVNATDVDFSDLDFRGEPRAFLETCELDGGGRLAASGWVSPMSWGRGVRAIEITVGDEDAGVTEAFSPRPEVARALKQVEAFSWRLTAPMPRVARRSQLPLVGRVVCDDGSRHVFHVSSLESALWTSELRIARRRGEKLRAARGYLEVLSTSADYHVEVLEARLAAVEGSSFWRLRNAWFRLKTVLGLAEKESWPRLPPWREVRGEGRKEGAAESGRPRVGDARGRGLEATSWTQEPPR